MSHLQLVKQGFTRKASHMAKEKLTHVINQSAQARQELECAFKNILVEECYIGRVDEVRNGTKDAFYIVLPTMQSPPHEWKDPNLCYHFSSNFRHSSQFDDLITQQFDDPGDLVGDYAKALLLVFLWHLHENLSKIYDDLVPMHELMKLVHDMI